ncbi:MAG TPA: phosphotransferase family protein [Ramlibacter sp.]|uniref:phosphotransferase family protein n=1 Tax=Ramlibacter sp. TaxID=1917967 RepID=UPI002B980502|nr:phosphotransferase family protein [Ramlibacter sp.]HVZ45226.1 phosphotransferase family protein [Ramlibacter sp.]
MFFVGQKYLMRSPEVFTAESASLPAGVQLAPPGAPAPHDWSRVGDYLAACGFPLDPGFTPRRFAGGLANLNFLLRMRNGEWVVLRRPPAGPLPPGAHDMAREHRILERLWRQLPLAPRSYHLCEDLAIAGAPFQLLEYRCGISIRGDSVAPLAETAQTGEALSRLLVEGLASIHSVDPAEAGLATLGKPEGFLARAARGWISRAGLVCDPTSPTVSGLAAWLEQHTAGLGGDGTLLHNDFKLDNLLLDPATLSPVAVLDWDMGTRGDALFDLATMLSYWSEAGDPECMTQLAQMPTARPGFLTREQAAVAYSRRTGRPLSDFKAYRVMAMFKLGVVFHQLYSRYRSGEVQDERYAGFGRLADGLLEFTQAIADDKYF